MAIALAGEPLFSTPEGAIGSADSHQKGAHNARSRYEGHDRRLEPAESQLREQTVPGISQAPGFVAGYWTRKDTTGLSMVLFESEEAANEMSEKVPSMVPDAVTLENVEVREVVAHA